MKQQLFKNSLSGVIQFVLTAGLALISIPIFISHLGSETYGVFATTSVIGNLAIFANLGLNSSLIKFIAEQGKSKESDFDIIVSLIIVIVMLLPLTFISLYFEKGIIINVLNVPKIQFDTVKILYRFLLVSNFILFSGNIMGAILSARQKTYTLNYIQLVYSILYWGLIITTILLGYNLKEIGLVILIATIVWFGLIIYFSIKEWGSIPKFSGLVANFKRIAKKQLGYGYQIYLAGLITFLYEPLTKILIANFIGIQEVGFFEIALKIRGYVISIISKAMQPLFPLFSEITETSKLRLLVHDVTQKALFLSLPLIIIIIYCTFPFISIWLNHDVAIISISVISIAGVYLITVTSTPNFLFLMSKDLAKKTIYIQLINVVVNSIVILTLFKTMGYYAVIIGNIVAILCAFSLNIFYQHRYLQSLIFDSRRQLINFILSALILLFIGFCLNKFITVNLIKLIVIPLGVFISCLLLYRHFSLITEVDINRYFYKDNEIKKKLKSFFIKYPVYKS